MKVLKVIKNICLTVLTILILFVLLMAVQYNHKSNPKNVKQFSVDNPFVKTDKTLIGAHRSGAGIMPEETMMAFKNCINDKSFDIDIFEFDLHITADNQLVLLHDDELDRTSDSEEVFGRAGVKAEEKTLVELKQLNMGAKFKVADGSFPYKNSTLQDLRIAELNEVLDYLTSQGDFRYIVELKDSGENGIKACEIFCENIIKRNMVDKVILSSFHSEVCDYGRVNYPQFTRSASKSEVVNTILTYLFVLHRKDFTPAFDVLIIPYGDYTEDFFVNTGTSGFLNFAHKKNLSVIYWTINKDKDMDYMLNLGVDGILSDYPDEVYKKRMEK